MGFREFGVSPGGALDQHALRVGNLLVGNAENTAGLEVTLGGLQIRFVEKRLVSWSGGQFEARIGSTELPAGHAAWIDPNEELVFGHSKMGCRCWLTISGGFAVETVLGSRATDLRGSFGGFHGRKLRDGDALPLGAALPPPFNFAGRISSWAAAADWTSTAKPNPVLRIIRGAHWDLFPRKTLARLTGESFSVSPDSDRMGVRLEGSEIKRDDDVDLVSEAVAPGTIQVPSGGQPIVLLGDCQTIGGYPKIAHVITVDLPIVAQLRAGNSVRFQEVSLGEAHQLFRERERELERFRIGLSLRAP